MALGAIGAVVLVDTRRLASSFAAVDFFEQRALPFVVAVNCFDGARRHRVAEIRTALDLDQRTPIVLCDARKPDSVSNLLIELVQHAINLA